MRQLSPRVKSLETRKFVASKYNMLLISLAHIVANTTQVTRYKTLGNTLSKKT